MDNDAGNPGAEPDAVPGPAGRPVACNGSGSDEHGDEGDRQLAPWAPRPEECAMKVKLALWSTLLIATIGLGFSGYLSYRELGAADDVNACAPVGAAGTVLGYPPCIYGLAMYLLIVVVVSLGLLGLRRESRGPAVHVA
jgi:hypothetical protein